MPSPSEGPSERPSLRPRGGEPPRPTPAYDRIGAGYSAARRPDPRLAAAIASALGRPRTVLNVGAGAGSYEPRGSHVVALDPSSVMLGQHPGRARVRGAAEALPFADGSFDAAMAILTVHHWSALPRGLTELRRVSSRQVIFTWDPDHWRQLWIVADYVPAIGTMERARFSPIDDVARALGAHTVAPFLIPHDFTDGFQAAFWRRPDAYLDPNLRRASSTFASLPDDDVVPGIERLRADLASGEWERRYGDLLSEGSLDYGYRIIVAGGPSGIEGSA